MDSIPVFAKSFRENIAPIILSPAVEIDTLVQCVRNSGNQPYPTSGLATGHKYLSTTFVSYLLRALSIKA